MESIALEPVAFGTLTAVRRGNKTAIPADRVQVVRDRAKSSRPNQFPEGYLRRSTRIVKIDQICTC